MTTEKHSYYRHTILFSHSGPGRTFKRKESLCQESPGCIYPVCRVIQRGNNREASFFTHQDYLFYLSCLGEACCRYHKASLVDAEQYLLTCYRYIELNPVVANMVKHPGVYAWSSSS